ncbi:MAG: lytic transglycosylase domain-containing protein [Candidatus Dormibacteraeota bacterium]|nr:lytic transglycosylase domain-containing protein [Candidatus Dormibacteraeota bacterium]
MSAPPESALTPRRAAAAAWRVRAGLALLPVLLGAGALTPLLAAHAGSTPAGQVAAALKDADRRAADAETEAARLQALPAPPVGIDQLRRQRQQEAAAYRLRAAVRDEQQAVFQAATDPSLEAAVARQLPPSEQPGLAAAASGLRSLWSLAGITDLSLVHARFSHPYRAAQPVASLSAFYRRAGAAYGVDWGVLAAINYIESDFGRTPGPSSAGALGPMQFLPSTWAAFGQGDIQDPADSIMAAARYLHHNGAPRDYQTAILAYNHDQDYVDAVRSFAAALAAEPHWLTRLYYWSTYG